MKEIYLYGYPESTNYPETNKFTAFLIEQKLIELVTHSVKDTSYSRVKFLNERMAETVAAMHDYLGEYEHGSVDIEDLYADAFPEMVANYKELWEKEDEAASKIWNSFVIQVRITFQDLLLTMKYDEN